MPAVLSGVEEEVIKIGQLEVQTGETFRLDKRKYQETRQKPPQFLGEKSDREAVGVLRWGYPDTVNLVLKAAHESV